jgi:hypothetical protein
MDAAVVVGVGNVLSDPLGSGAHIRKGLRRRGGSASSSMRGSDSGESSFKPECDGHRRQVAERAPTPTISTPLERVPTTLHFPFRRRSPTWGPPSRRFVKNANP